MVMIRSLITRQPSVFLLSAKTNVCFYFTFSKCWVCLVYMPPTLRYFIYGLSAFWRLYSLGKLYHPHDLLFTRVLSKTLLLFKWDFNCFTTEVKRELKQHLARNSWDPSGFKPTLGKYVYSKNWVTVRDKCPQMQTMFERTDKRTNGRTDRQFDFIMPQIVFGGIKTFVAH